jgi:hypothetical protein
MTPVGWAVRISRVRFKRAPVGAHGFEQSGHFSRGHPAGGMAEETSKGHDKGRLRSASMRIESTSRKAEEEAKQSLTEQRVLGLPTPAAPQASVAHKIEKHLAKIASRSTQPRQFHTIIILLLCPAIRPRHSAFAVLAFALAPPTPLTFLTALPTPLLR